MHPQVKHARFNLIVCSATVLLTTGTYIVARILLGPHRARGAFGFFGLLGLLGLGPTFYHRRHDLPGVVVDERDKQISERASIVAWRAVWVYWCLICMGPWVWVAVRSGLDAVEAPSIAVEWLPWALMLALVVFSLAWSAAVIKQYRRGEPEADE